MVAFRNVCDFLRRNAALLSILFMFFPFVNGCMAFHSGPMPGEPKNATFATVDGTRVRYIDVGQGPAVVLVHGFASSLETWAGVIPALSQKHRVIALDLKGFGWTDRPEGDYSPEAQAQLVLHLMDLRGVDRASIVAHSWGASVALAAALAAPQQISRLALYDAWVYEEQLPPFFHWARSNGVGEMLFGLYYKERADEKMALAFFDKSYVTEELVDAVESAMDRPGTVAAALAAVRGQNYAAIQQRYRNVTQPTLLLWGREDIVTTSTFGERLSRDLPSSKLIVYPRCGHFPMIEASSASNRDLVSFLEADVATVKSSSARPVEEAP